MLPAVELSSGPSSPGVDTSNPQAKTEIEAAANLQSTAALSDSLAAAPATAPAAAVAVVPAIPVKRKLCSWHIVTVFL